MLRNRQLMHVMSTIALSAVCSLLAVSNLLELFSTKAYTYIVWLVPLVFALCIGLLHHFMTKFSIVEVACLIVAQCIIAPIIVEHDTTALYILPTISTLYQGFQDFVRCWKLLISLTPPVDSQQNTYMALWVLSFWFTYVNCRIATQSRRNRALMLMPVCLAQFALCAWLGGYHGFGRPFAGCALLVCLLLWFAWSAGATTQKRAILASLCTLLLAIPLSFSVESQRFLARNMYTPPIESVYHTSPLSQMRAVIKKYQDTVLFSVSGMPSHTPIRLATMESYDGNIWHTGKNDSVFSSYMSSGDNSTSNFGNVSFGTVNNTNLPKLPFTVTFRLHRYVMNYWLPLLGETTAIQMPSVSENELLFNHFAQTAILNKQPQTTFTYQQTGVIPQFSEKILQRSTSGNIDQPAINHIPSSLQHLARNIVGNLPNAGMQMQALTEYLSHEGWFSHGLTNDYPSLSGHGNYRLQQLISQPIMVGDSEQYASALALMARSLQIPSRVVLGFRKHDDIHQLPSSSQEITFVGSDIEAWCEVYLQNIGWVGYFPTPDPSRTPEPNAMPENVHEQSYTPPSIPLSKQLYDTIQKSGNTTLSGQPSDKTQSFSQQSRFLLFLRIIATRTLPLWCFLAISSLIIGSKYAYLYMLHKRSRLVIRIPLAWSLLVVLTRQLRIPVPLNASRSVQSQVILAHTQLNANATALLERLQKQADSAAFSKTYVTQQQSQQYWKSVLDFIRCLKLTVPLRTRLFATYSFRGLFSLYRQVIRRKLFSPYV